MSCIGKKKKCNRCNRYWVISSRDIKIKGIPCKYCFSCRKKKKEQYLIRKKIKNNKDIKELEKDIKEPEKDNDIKELEKDIKESDKDSDKDNDIKELEKDIEKPTVFIINKIEYSKQPEKDIKELEKDIKELEKDIEKPTVYVINKIEYSKQHHNILSNELGYNTQYLIPINEYEFNICNSEIFYSKFDEEVII